MDVTPCHASGMRRGPLANVKRVCLVSGCAEWATRGGRCPTHQLPRASPRPWARLVQAVLKRDGRVCQLCGGRATTADHVLRVVEGGDDRLSNLRAVCAPCNQRRG